MTGTGNRGPIGSPTNSPIIDGGTLNRGLSPPPGPKGVNKPPESHAAKIRREGLERRQVADQRYYAEVKKGTREFVEDKEQNVRILVERQQDGLFHWLIETLDGNQMCEGVHDPKINFTAEMCIDKTSKTALKALEEEVKIARKKPDPRPPQKKPEPQPPQKKEVVREVIVIVKDDWLSRIALKKWRDPFAWKKYLKPTERTRQDRIIRGRAFDPNRIYPGDTFEVIGGWNQSVGK